MSDNEILGDVALLVFKDEAERRRRGNFHDNAPRYVPIQAEELLALIARLERAESQLKDITHSREYTHHLLLEALKCLAEAPEVRLEEVHHMDGTWSVEHTSPDCCEYYRWYHSPTRQNLLKGVK